MYTFDAIKLLAPLSYIGGKVSEWRVLKKLDGIALTVSVDFDERVAFMQAVEQLKATASILNMTTSVAIIERGWETAVRNLAAPRPQTQSELTSLVEFGHKLLEVFVMEAESRAFIVLSPSHSKFMHQSESSFGDAVDDAFPDAIPEIADAGRCRCFGMWTASVMHLMRAAEAPLSVLAQYLGIEIAQNWNTTLNQIDKELKERTRSLHGADEEQWASEAAAHLRSIKNAWRNYAQHGGARYDEREAIAIWNNVQSLMQTLAKKLSGAQSNKLRA